MESTQSIFGHLEKRPFSLKRWFKENIVGVLGTLIFHILILILFLLIKIQSIKEIRELGITLNFNDIKETEMVPTEKKINLTPEEIAILDKLLANESKASNLASNTSEMMEKKISTKNYVEQVEMELEKSRSDEWRKKQEEIQNKINQQDFIPEENINTKASKNNNYTGLTNITYEFLESPFNRFKTILPVPVYKCQGEGTVLVDVTVDQNGKVLTSRAFTQIDFPDMDCMIEVAEKYALLTQFQGNLTAPKAQRARIVYKFIAQ